MYFSILGQCGIDGTGLRNRLPEVNDDSKNDTSRNVRSFPLGIGLISWSQRISNS